MLDKGIIGASRDWPTAVTTGPTVQVAVRPGVFVKMLEAEARARGLIPAETKTKNLPPARNKKREPVSNKAE